MITLDLPGAAVMTPLPPRSPSSFCLLTAAIWLAGSPLAVAANSDSSPLLAPPPAPASDPAPRPRAISAGTAARLAALAPPFTPPAPAPSATSAATDVDDRPRNGIIRLPRYIVQQPKEKIPALSEIQVLTPKGKIDLALRAFPGLRVGSFWIFRNDGVALRMLEDELMAERKRRATDLATLLPTNATPDNPLTDDKRRRLIQDALAPRSSWTTMAPDHDPGK